MDRIALDGRRGAVMKRTRFGRERGVELVAYQHVAEAEERVGGGLQDPGRHRLFGGLADLARERGERGLRELASEDRSDLQHPLSRLREYRDMSPNRLADSER